MRPVSTSGSQPSSLPLPCSARSRSIFLASSAATTASCGLAFRKSSSDGRTRLGDWGSELTRVSGPVVGVVVSAASGGTSTKSFLWSFAVSLVRPCILLFRLYVRPRRGRCQYVVLRKKYKHGLISYERILTAYKQRFEE